MNKIEEARWGMALALSRFSTEIPRAEYYSIGALMPDISSDLSQPNEGFRYYLPQEYIDRKERWEEIPKAYCVGTKRRTLHHCVESTTHVTHRYYTHADPVCIYGNGELTPFVETMQTAYPLVSESLANKLAEAGLRGLTIVPAKMDYVNTGRTIRDQVYLLSGPEPLPTVTRRVSPNIDNRCPVCSFSPVFCSACGFVSDPCPQCRSKLIQHGAANSTGHRQFKLSEVFPPELNRAAGAIDLARCAKGLDFSGTLDYSRRAMEFLLSLNAYPMEILPLRTRFENGRVGLTREDAE